MHLRVVVLAAAMPERLGAVRALVRLLARMQAVVHGQVLLHLELGRAHVAPPAPLRVVGTGRDAPAVGAEHGGGLRYRPEQVGAQHDAEVLGQEGQRAALARRGPRTCRDRGGNS